MAEAAEIETAIWVAAAAVRIANPAEAIGISATTSETTHRGPIEAAVKCKTGNRRKDKARHNDPRQAEAEEVDEDKRWNFWQLSIRPRY